MGDDTMADATRAMDWGILEAAIAKATDDDGENR